jgi:hypothetical protein
LLLPMMPPITPPVAAPMPAPRPAFEDDSHPEIIVAVEKSMTKAAGFANF